MRITAKSTHFEHVNPLKMIWILLQHEFPIDPSLSILGTSLQRVNHKTTHICPMYFMFHVSIHVH